MSGDYSIHNAAALRRLVDIVLADARLDVALNAASNAGLGSWIIGAGVIRNVVWDTVFEVMAPTPFRDVDLAYYDPDDLSSDAEKQAAERVAALAPEIPWEVTNQARVHHWYRQHFGIDADPITSIEDAVSRFPETCTAIGISLEHDGSIRVIAPFGLDDLFSGVLRRNPRQVSLEQFQQRTRAKRILETWPGVKVIYD